MAKKSRFTGFSAAKIVEEINNSSSGKGENSYQGETWTPGMDKDQDSAEFIVRFLPNLDEETDIHFITRPTHMIKFTSSGNYIYEPCPQRNGKAKACPICEVVSPLFKGSDAEKKVAFAQYAKARFYSNVYIIKDERNGGENEGKILMYEYGKTINDLCVKSMSVDEDDEDDTDPVVYFDPLEGADFKIIAKRSAGFPNYDDSKFIRKGKPLKLKDGTELDEDNIDEFMEGAFNLKEKLLGDEKFKSYDDLKKIYENQGYDKSKGKKEKEKDDDDDDDDIDEDSIEESFSKKKVQARNPDTKKPIKEEKDVDDEDYSIGKDDDDDDDDELASLLSDDD